MAGKVHGNSKYTVELANEICERLACGESLISICKDEHMPDKLTVIRWVNRDESGFRHHYELARKNQAEHYFDELMDIVDSGENDYVNRKTKNGEMRVVDHEHIARSRLRFDARRWVLSQMLPKKYADQLTRLDLTSSDGTMSPNRDIPDDKLATRLEELHRAALRRKQEAESYDGSDLV